MNEEQASVTYWKAVDEALDRAEQAEAEKRELLAELELIKEIIKPERICEWCKHFESKGEEWSMYCHKCSEGVNKWAWKGAKTEVCTWKIDTYCGSDDRNYTTSCDEMFAFLEGGPVENEMKFCPYCGKKLVLGE